MKNAAGSNGEIIVRTSGVDVGAQTSGEPGKPHRSERLDETTRYAVTSSRGKRKGQGC
jgi:hypothetical protein